MNDARFESAVERTARTMLDVSPAADFRGRVLARIAEPRARMVWNRTVWAAAAAILVLGAVLLRDAPARAPVVSPPRASAPGAASRGAARQVPPADPPPPAVRAVSRGEHRVAEPLPSVPDDLPPIQVDEIVVAPPAAPAEIEPDEIVIAPLPEPADVAVEPLPSGATRE